MNIEILIKKHRRYFKYILGLTLIVIAFLIIYPKLKSSYHDIPILLKEANKAFLLFLVIFQSICYLGDGWLSKILLKIAGFNLKFKDTLKIAVLDVIGGQLIPLIGGSVITYFFYRKLKVSSGAILFLITGWTIFTLFSYFLFFLLSLIFLPKSFLHLISPKSIFIILILVIFLLVLSCFLFKERGKLFLSILIFFVRIINRAGRFFRKNEIINTERPKIFVSDFYKSFDLLLINKTKIPQALLAAILFYAGDISTLYFSFLVFGFRPNPALLIFGFTVGTVLPVFTLLAETPGVMEASLTLIFIGLGFPVHIALFSTLLFRIFSYWLPLPIGIFSYFKLKK
ncbi:MAG: flippase-like domain-containing protein [Actinobacteria bacterium]|nr:flippase-like domain-containing protein [Cyanobacteriota bacterium]MCL5771475.1 flippase-like domain-containing protein [Actinomycetota bacterium]